MDLPKIALISEEYPPFMFGGIASVCHDLARALSGRGVDTTVFCGRAARPTTEKTSDGLKVVRLPCFDYPPRFIWFQAQNLRLLSRLLKDYSVVHIVNPEAGVSIAHIGKKLRKNVVTSIHGTYLYGLKKYFASPFKYWIFKDIGYHFLTYPLNSFSYEVCLRHSDSIAVCSRSTLSELKTIYSHLDLRKACVIPNGIDFRAIDTNPGNVENFPSIICYGRLLWVKGFQYLIQATAYLKKSFPDIRVRIFGNGPFRSRLEAMISDLGLHENIHLKSFVPRDILYREIKTSSLVVVPSLHEAQPVSVLEAMACRKTVVAFDLPFSQELIHNRYNGVLARPADARDLADKIQLVLSDRKLRLKLGQNAYEYVKKEHDWNTLAEKYVQLYMKAR